MSLEAFSTLFTSSVRLAVEIIFLSMISTAFPVWPVAWSFNGDSNDFEGAKLFCGRLSLDPRHSVLLQKVKPQIIVRFYFSLLSNITMTIYNTCFTS